MRPAAALLALSLVLAALMPGCGRAPGGPPHLILIVVDSLRADHVGAYGYPRPTTPNIDRLAAGGVLFANATAPSSWTKPSVASLFTSRYPSEHGAVAFDRQLAPDVPTLAERLREAGYHTLGVTGNPVHIREETGLHRGFDGWKSFLVPTSEDDANALWGGEAAEDPHDLRAPSGAELNREVLARLPAALDGPVFVYVHYMEPHAGYAPPERQRRAFATSPAEHARRGAASTRYVTDLAARKAGLEPAERQWLLDLYDAEIAAVDVSIGQLLAALEKRGFADNMLVAIVADHGEEFGEHEGWFHGLTLHGESRRVPLIFHPTRGATGGVRREEPVDLLDVPTTLLAAAGVEPVAGMRGRALLGPGPLPERDLVGELHADPPFEERLGPRLQRLALTRWPWKAIVWRDDSRAFYRLDRDPGERSPLRSGDAAPPELQAALAALERRLVAAPGPASVPGSGEREGLRALGYAE